MQCFSICLFYISFILSLAHLEVNQAEKSIFDIKYRAYTKDNPEKEVQLSDINFNDGMKTIFIIHGYLTPSLADGRKIKDVIFKTETDVGRVIIVDWRGLNMSLSYSRVAEKTVPRVA